VAANADAAALFAAHQASLQRRAWIFRIARNLAIDHLRRHEVRFAVGTGALDELPRPAAQDTSVAVNEALATLDPVDRDVFLMREIGGLSYAEVAGACDLTVAAVRSRIHRARLSLRSRLSDRIAAVLDRETRG
jgi:RNA polymerase sigma-70 factor (ECF subfamily)